MGDPRAARAAEAGVNRNPAPGTIVGIANGKAYPRPAARGKHCVTAVKDDRSAGGLSPRGGGGNDRAQFRKGVETGIRFWHVHAGRMNEDQRTESEIVNRFALT